MPNTQQAAAHGIRLPAKPSKADRVLSPNQIGKIMNVTGEAVKQWILNRRLPAVKHSNGYWTVKVCDLEAFLKTRHEIARRLVLIADSRDGRISSVIEAVEHLGHKAIVARNLADAMMKSLDHYPALFVIGLDDGWAEPWKFAEKIRATKGLRKFPILLVAESDLDDDDSERAVELSIQGFVRLPSEKETLVAEIRRIMDRLV